MRVAARSAVDSLARVRWFAPFGMGFASHFVMRSLTQVTQYLSDNDLREQALSRVNDLLTPNTQVLIGHSLALSWPSRPPRRWIIRSRCSSRSDAHWASIPSCTNGSVHSPLDSRRWFTTG